MAVGGNHRRFAPVTTAGWQSMPAAHRGKCIEREGQERTAVRLAGMACIWGVWPAFGRMCTADQGHTAAVKRETRGPTLQCFALDSPTAATEMHLRLTMGESKWGAH